MILRNFHWIILLSVHLFCTITAQNDKSYDENDWIPITPSNAANPKEAQGRVLNLETPNQNFFPENEYVRKPAPTQQYLRETGFNKAANTRQPKPDHPYKFEPVVPLQTAQYVPQNQFIQQQVQPQFIQPVQHLPYVQPQTVQIQQVQQEPVQIQPIPQIQRPAQEPTLNQQLVAPPQSNQNYYNTVKNNQQKSVPLNYQALNLATINRELLGAIQNQNVNQITTTTTTKPKEEKETIQLLYVPLENLKSSQPVTQRVTTPKQVEAPRKEKQISRLENHRLSHLTTDIQDDFIRQALAAHKLQQQLQSGQPVVLQTTTTPKPKKRKANQPPLAVFMEKQGKAEVKDVLNLLKDAKSISVQDSVGPNSPPIFVGPSNIEPEGYAKFPLPYLSTVQGNRIERKVEQLPFFVAPLSYKTPEGYSKIPLPSPHVGSVVVSTKDQLHEKHPEYVQPQTAQNQIVQDFDVKQPFPDYRDEPRPNPYLLNQANEFVGGFPNIPPNYDDYQSGPKVNEPQQDYPQTPVKEFVPDYQDSPPRNYQTEDKTNDGNNFQSPDYQTNDGKGPNQDTKELIRNYDIPSVPVESKASFTPNYQEEARPENQYQSSIGPESKPSFTPNYQNDEKPQNQYQNDYVTPKAQPNVYNYDQGSVRQTTEANPQNQFRYQNQESEYRAPQYNTRQDPLRQGINPYEIQQINNQFGREKEERPEVLRSTTPVITTKNYDYDIPTTTRTRSRSRFRGRTTAAATTPTTPSTVADDKYTVLEEFAIQPKTTTAKYTTEVETIPAKVYKLEPEQPVFVQTQAPAKHVLNQDTLDQQILQISKPQPVAPEPVVYHQNQYPQEQEQYPPHNPYLPGLINNLQDQAVRPLLVPNLLVPTTEKLTTVPPPSIEEVRVTTTEAPRIETTTIRRNRGRQRAHSRFSTTQAPRRTASRRRPNYTRPTTERQHVRTTTETPDYEPTKRGTSQRQRFRTRGRPIQKEEPATERVLQTTETGFKQPPLEGGFQASSGDPQSYMQYDHVVENQQVITAKPEETPYKDYHQVYSLPPQTQPTERPFEEVSTTSKPVVDVKVTHSVPDRSQEPSNEDRYVRVQSGGVIHNNKHDEATQRTPARTRGRARIRSRFSSTTPRPTTTTTEKLQKQEEQDEDYGFIRKPSYERAPQVVTQQPLQLYSASYQEIPRTIIQVEDDSHTKQTQDYDTTSPVPVQFVGQIRPKYTTTEAQEPSTEAPKSRGRVRIRVPSRKATSQQQQSYNELKSHRYDDQVTRRSSNVVRTRGRGKSHFKLPEQMTVKDDEHDVEGGNYPASYLKNRELTTERPSSFQITIDPSDEEDQVPHSSLYSPQIIKSTDTQWVEATNFPKVNELETEDKQTFVTIQEEQTTLPYEESETETETAQTEPITTTEAIDTTTIKIRKIGRRRGVWKLVKHRPVDSFDTAESQNYFSVINAFESVEKVNDKFSETVKPTTTTTTEAPSTTTTPTTTSTESSIFDTLYNFLGLASKASQLPGSKTKISFQKEEVTTTTVSPTFPEEITEEITTQEMGNHEVETFAPETTTTTTTEASIKNYDIEPWEERDVKTSTSTEVSHETEICFKGRCVKSKDDDSS
ncbi:mucin-2 isoform X1 [Tribolium castaneum]|uniref:mucin-2 isoform X1 n=1 Tax=Tribolium castaneum TaxID=7070 RepID=UPI0030FE7630